MRNKFALWSSEYIAFPKTLTIGSSIVSINSDFRVILKILAIYDDPEVSESQKIRRIISWFYTISTEIILLEPRLLVKAMVEFIAPPKDVGDDLVKKAVEEHKKSLVQETSKKPNYCFEFDAEEIYVSFLQDYKIDLVTIEYLHWYKFLMLFSNLDKETAFGRKLELRTLDLKDFKGKDKTKLAKAQREVQIPVKLNSIETEMVNTVMAKLLASVPAEGRK